MDRLKLRKGLLMVSMVLACLSVFSQNTVKGVVKDDTGFGLPMASVLVKGTTTGVTTDLEGNFTIQMPAGRNEIEVSYLGYVTQVVDVTGKTFVEVVLGTDAIALEEIVVTALGIKRDAKSLGYSVQQVGADDLAGANRVSPLTGLAGQVAGLQISESGSGAGGSMKIQIRGANSLTGNNAPLFVVDGVPMDNSGGSSGSQFGGFDYGNAVNNINMDDVESISVLKGGAASALYGSRGQNGVIMITTKSGSKKDGIGLTYQASFSVREPLVKPNFQTNYSQGSGGNFIQLGTRSWGAKMEGQSVTNFLGQTQSLVQSGVHAYDEFFRNPINIDHSISIDKRDEKTGILFSAVWNLDKGMIPTNSFDKKTFNIRYDTKLSEFLTLDARANYIVQEGINRPNLSGSPDNPVYLFATMPASVNLSHLRNYQTVTGLPVVWSSRYMVNPDGTVQLNQASPSFASSPLLQNPFWASELNTNNDIRNRLMGFASIDLDLKKLLNLGFQLNLKMKGGLDVYNDERERITAHNTYYKAEGLATGNFRRLQVSEGNYDFLLTGNKQMGDFFLSLSAGGNIMQKRIRSINTSSESGLINPVGPYVIQNFMNPIATNGIYNQDIHSLYAFLSTDFKRMVFLDLTFRNDWNSVLHPSVWSYQYPSVSVSWLLEETFQLPNQFNMLKLRASYAGVGSGGDNAGQRYFTYGTTANQFHGLPYGFFNQDRPEALLVSEYTISKEIGLQAIMFGSRLNLDVAFYQTGTKDQIFRSPLPPSSGFNNGWINSGFVNNTGLETFGNVKIIDKKKLGWTAGFNFTRQWSKVEEIHPDLDRIYQGGVADLSIVALLGQPAGAILGTAFDRDEQGRIILDVENLPRIKSTESGAIITSNLLGFSTPDILWGFNSTITFNDFALSVFVDSKLGHDIFSYTNLHGAIYGTLGFTTQGRDDWYRAVQLASTDPNLNPEDFNMGYVVRGVKNGEEGEYAVDPQKYWDRVSRIHEAFIYDASYIRLRQVSITYNISPQLLAKIPIRTASISFSASNLFYLMRKTENISPESSFGTGNNLGFEIFGYPEMRTFGANLRVTF